MSQRRGGGAVVIESAPGKNQRSQVACGGGAERGRVGEFERAARDGERHRIARIEAGVGHGREGYLAGSTNGHVGRTQQ